MSARQSSAARAASREDTDGLDYSERAGFLTGKAAAMADWSHRKEDAAYAKLFARLYARNWARLKRARDPAGVRAAQQSWREQNREHVRELDRRQKRARRLSELKAKGITYRVIDGVPRRTYWVVCAVCLAEEEKLQPGAKFCSTRCRNRYHGAPRARARNRGLRNMTLAATALTVLEIESGLTLGEIHKRMPTAKYGSLATWLCDAAKRGEVIRRGGGRSGRYELAPRGADEGSG